MEKRYQVFVSSTFVDLQDARGAVFQTLMQMDCIPAGMELFPAMDEEQMHFITKVIDDCDYYLLILGGRYGSVSAEGISYTEMEYDYAVSKGLKVLAFIHDRPEEIPSKYTDADNTVKAKLDAFRDKVSTGRLVSHWNNPKDLPGMVALGLLKTIKNYPAIGWVRADQVSSSETVKEQNELLKELEGLRKELEHYRTRPVQVVADLAGLDEKFTFGLTAWAGMDRQDWKPTMTWRQIFVQIAPDLQALQHDHDMRSLLSRALYSPIRVRDYNRPSIDNEDFKTIRTQLSALGLIHLEEIDQKLTWRLTPAGAAMMVNERTVKTQVKSQN